MNDLWLNIKAWAQRILLALLVIYFGLYIYKNSGMTVKLWWWFRPEFQTTVFVLTSGAFVVGILFTFLATTTLRTLKQIREMRHRGRQERLEKDIEEMKNKAAMLQTRPGGFVGDNRRCERHRAGYEEVHSNIEHRTSNVERRNLNVELSVQVHCCRLDD